MSGFGNFFGGLGNLLAAFGSDGMANSRSGNTTRQGQFDAMAAGSGPVDVVATNKPPATPPPGQGGAAGRDARNAARKGKDGDGTFWSKFQDFMQEGGAVGIADALDVVGEQVGKPQTTIDYIGPYSYNRAPAAPNDSAGQQGLQALLQALTARNRVA